MRTSHGRVNAFGDGLLGRYPQKPFSRRPRRVSALAILTLALRLPPSARHQRTLASTAFKRESMSPSVRSTRAR